MSWEAVIERDGGVRGKEQGEVVGGVLQNFVCFIILILIRILVLGGVRFLHITAPFLCLCFVLGVPIKDSQAGIIFFSFLVKLAVSIFSGAPKVRTFTYALTNFVHRSLVRLLVKGSLPRKVGPSCGAFKCNNFFHCALLFIIVRRITLFLVRSLALFSPLFLTVHVTTDIIAAALLVYAVRTFGVKSRGDKSWCRMCS